MIPDTISGENDQADMAETLMGDLPDTDDADGTDTDVDVDADENVQSDEANDMEDAQEDAAERREDEGGYQ